MAPANSYPIHFLSNKSSKWEEMEVTSANFIGKLFRNVFPWQNLKFLIGIVGYPLGVLASVEEWRCWLKGSCELIDLLHGMDSYKYACVERCYEHLTPTGLTQLVSCIRAASRKPLQLCIVSSTCWCMIIWGEMLSSLLAVNVCGDVRHRVNVQLWEIMFP